MLWKSDGVLTVHYNRQTDNEKMTADKEIFFSNYDYYWLKYTMDRGIQEQARYLVAGHSLARFGINDRDIPGLINLAFLSQDYYYSYRIIEKAFDYKVVQKSFDSFCKV